MNLSTMRSYFTNVDSSRLWGFVVCSSLLCWSSSTVSAADDNLIEADFQVKPGAGKLRTDIDLKSYTCSFTYAAQGGTGEQWKIRLELVDNGGAAICTVERPSSYLFFEHFRMDLKGPDVGITDVELKASQRDNANLKPEEFVKQKTYVASVKEGFQNHLEKVAVFSPLVKEDL